MDPGHRSTHACTDTLGGNTISSERTGKKQTKKTNALKKNKDIYGVKERGCIFFRLQIFFYMLYAQYEHFWTVLQRNKRLSFLKKILKSPVFSQALFNDLSLVCVSSFQIHCLTMLMTANIYHLLIITILKK